jgi:hypothetical protein
VSNTVKVTYKDWPLPFEAVPVAQRRPLTFTKRDLKRAMDACAGRDLSVCIRANGDIIIEPRERTGIVPANEWDSVS